MMIGDLLTRGIDEFFRQITERIISPAVDAFVTAFMGAESVTALPFFMDLMETGRAAGMLLITLFGMWAIFQSLFSFAITSAEEPQIIAVRMVIGYFTVWYAGEILLWIVDFTKALSSDISASVLQSDQAVAEMARSVTRLLTSGPLALTFLSWEVIPVIYITYKCIRLLIRMFQRHVLLAFLVITSPLAFSCGVRKATEGFRSGFVKVVAGNLAIQIVQSFCLAAIARYALMSETNLMLNFAIIIGIFYVLDRAEPIIREMSITTGLERDMGGALSLIQTSAGVVSNVSTFVKVIK